MVGIKQKWLNEVHDAYKVGIGAEKEAYEGMGQLIITSYTETKVVPFYTTHGIKPGFLNRNINKVTYHAAFMVYAGAFLSIFYDVATSGKLHLV